MSAPRVLPCKRSRCNNVPNVPTLHPCIVLGMWRCTLWTFTVLRSERSHAVRLYRIEGACVTLHSELAALEAAKLKALEEAQAKAKRDMEALKKRLQDAETQQRYSFMTLCFKGIF